ncbi:pyocin immunity protein [Salmonella enterica]|nr:pyocin immunity protein [Salmonella enterica]
MTVNVDALINCLGKSYSELLDAELVPYKSPPKGSSGTPTISLDMALEGVFLSFWREGRILKSITLRMLHETAVDWTFPNDLPAPLQKSMSRQWVHEHIGEPLRCSPPYVVMKKAFGWTDLYEAKGRSIPTSMQVNYDVMDNVRSVTFMPTAELRW